MRRFLGLTILAVMVVSSCKTLGDIPTTRPLGAFQLAAKSAGQGAYTTSPTAIFLQASNFQLPDSRNPPDTCQDQTIVNDTSLAVYPNQLDAGTPITVQQGATTGQMTPDTIPNHFIQYALDGNGEMPYEPGGDVTFAIPGVSGGFQGSTFTIHTAKPLILGPILTDSAKAFTITWNSQSNAASVVIRLQYASDTLAALPDREIFCSVIDDGNTTISTRQAVVWQKSKVHEVLAYRYITTFQNVGDGLLWGVARFDTSKVDFP